MEFHHVVIHVPIARIAEFEAHVAANASRLDAPAGFAIAIARDDDEPGVYYLSSVLGDRTTVFAAVRAAGGGDILLHPLLERFGAAIVRRDRGQIVGLASPRANHPIELSGIESRP